MQISTIVFTCSTALGTGAGLYAQELLYQALPDQAEKIGHLREIHSKGYGQWSGVDRAKNIILHPERKAVLVDLHSAHETKDPKDEMDAWADLVYYAGGWRQSMEEGLSIEEALIARGYEDAAQLEKAKRLQKILDRAMEMEGVEAYSDYDALVSDLETLLI